MVSQHISRLCILLFGSLYPAYSSYKAIKNKDIREYSRWMMYWIVFAIFSFCEIFADIFIGIWLPFYYETKILFVLWLMSPYGNGARIMYKHLIHPELNKREHIIDEYITSAKELGVSSIWHLYRKISAFINKIMLQFIQMIHTAMFNQLQRNVYNIQPEQSKQMVNSRPLLTQPNLFQWMMNASTSVVKTENQESQQLNSNVQPVASNDSTINNPLYQRWFSEEALNIVEIDQSMISNEIINVRSLSESETNLDDWEKMDATENVADLDNACDKLNNKSTKPKIKRSRNVKITTTPVRRTTRAAAVKARAKAKVQDLDEDN